MGRMKVIYVAGPYSGASAKDISENVALAAEVGQEIMRRGHAVVCPHTMTHDWDIRTGLEYQDFLDMDLELLRRCDAICMVPGWETSHGSLGELELAKNLGKEIFESPLDVPDLRSDPFGAQ
jgi:hypothetical protein